MKKRLIEILACPCCLPGERRLSGHVARKESGDIIAGSLTCDHCGRRFPIRDGVAFLIPADGRGGVSKYETPQALSFVSDTFSSQASLNLVGKVPSPLGHLRETNRVADGRLVRADRRSFPPAWNRSPAPTPCSTPFTKPGACTCNRPLSTRSWMKPPTR